MKFVFVLLTVLALSTCNTDLEATIDREKAIRCIRYAEPVLEDIVNIVNIFQEKNYGQLIPKLTEVVEHVKEIIGNCIGQKSDDVVLQVPVGLIIWGVNLGIKLIKGIIGLFKRKKK